MNAFFGDEIYYDLEERNYIIASMEEAESGVQEEEEPGVYGQETGDNEVQEEEMMEQELQEEGA